MLPVGKSLAVVSLSLVLGMGGACAPRADAGTQTAPATTPETVAARLSAFAQNPTSDGFTVALGNGDKREVETGWTRHSRFVGGAGFGCEALVVASSSGTVAAWGYHCWPGKNGLPESLTNNVQGEWFQHSSGRREFGRFVDLREKKVTPTTDREDIRVAFDYLDTPLHGIPGPEIGPACSKSKTPISAPRAVRDFMLLAESGEVALIEQLLSSLDPEARALAASWIHENPKTVSPRASERAAEILQSSIAIMVRDCGEFDTASLPKPIKETHGLLAEAVRR